MNKADMDRTDKYDHVIDELKATAAAINSLHSALHDGIPKYTEELMHLAACVLYDCVDQLEELQDEKQA